MDVPLLSSSRSVTFRLEANQNRAYVTAREHGALVMDDNSVDRRAAEWSRTFGAMVKERRRAQGLRQDELALATGVGRRFLSELESGKSTTQLGKALLVAETLGMRLDALLEPRSQAPADFTDLPAPGDELPLEEDEDGPSPRPL